MTWLIQEVADCYRMWSVKSKDRTASAIKEEIDPISVLATIAMMPYKSRDSKLRLAPYKVVAQEPTDHYLRGSWRWLQRTGHEDLDIIKICLNKAASWYHAERADNEEIRTLFQSVRIGLEKLKETYTDKSGSTVDFLEAYQKNIDELLTPDLLKLVPNADELPDPLQNKIRDLWTTTEIKLVNDYLRVMEEKKGNCRDTVEFLEFTLARKQEELRRICVTS